MYSRNYPTGNVMPGVRLNPGHINDVSRNHSERIPVKSYTDNFAYERFNRMDNFKEEKNYDDFTKNGNNPEHLQEESIEETEKLPEEKTQADVCDSVKVPADVPKENTILYKLKNAFDADTVLIILAVLMLLFSDNATNDKLSPLALLAILFL